MIVRVKRLLVYEGNANWVAATLAKGAVPADGLKWVPDNKAVIRSITGKPRLLTDRELALAELDAQARLLGARVVPIDGES